MATPTALRSSSAKCWNRWRRRNNHGKRLQHSSFSFCLCFPILITPMKRAAVFFDRDNTLIVADGYLGDPAQVRLVDGAADAVARVRQLGFAPITFSNQSGVARGKYSENAVHAVNARLDELLAERNPA